MQEMYTPPPPGPAKPFAGAGRRLGAVVPGEGSALVAAPPAAAASSAPTTTLSLTLHPGEPTTQLSVRCVDGTRLTLTLNPTHTVGDVRAHLQAVRPVPGPFSLFMPMPRREFGDDAQTIQAAGLSKGSVVQKML
jgi:UBX domain-containing protein 1